MPESSSSTEPRYAVGRLGRPHGLDGYIGLYVDEVDLVYFEPGKSVLIMGDSYVVAEARGADRGHHLKLEGVDSREQAEAIRGNDVYVSERRELEADEFWPEELVGLEVRDAQGERLGAVTSLVTGGAQDRLVVDTGSGSYEVPFVRDLVPEVDLAAGFLVIAAIPGLIGSSD